MTSTYNVSQQVLDVLVGKKLLLIVSKPSNGRGISAAMLCQNVNKLSRIFRLFDFDGYFCLIPIQNLLEHQVCQYVSILSDFWFCIYFTDVVTCNFVTKLGFNIKTGLPEGSIFEERSSETEFSIGFLVKFCRN